MSRKIRPQPKPKRRATFIKAWRKHRNGLTLAKLVERLEVEEGFQLSEGQLSRIERGEQPYSQDLLEAISHVLRCEPADLIMRDPTDPDGLWTIYDALTPPERRQVVEIAKTLKRTGTEG